MKRAVKKTTEKYLTENKFGMFEKKFQVFESTFEKHMTNIAKSFSKIDERFTQHDKAFELILKQMQSFTNEAREHRQTMSSLINTDVKQERTVEDLRIRIERLEMQMK